MNRTAKVLLLVFLGLGVVVVLLALLGVAWWKANGEKVMGGANDSLIEGQEFGRGVANKTACVDEAMGRLSTCNGVMCGINLQLFTQSCLTTAPDEAGFCDGVPAQTDFMDSFAFQRDTCARYGRDGHQLCPNVAGTVQAYCANPTAALPVGTAAGGSASPVPSPGP